MRDNFDLQIKSPQNNGSINDWDCMEKIWEHCFNEQLMVNIEEFRVLISEAASKEAKNEREKICEKMFETFRVRGFYIKRDSVLTLFNSGRTTGTVCYSGHDISYAKSVWEGFELPYTAK